MSIWQKMWLSNSGETQIKDNLNIDELVFHISYNQIKINSINICEYPIILYWHHNLYFQEKSIEQDATQMLNKS